GGNQSQPYTVNIGSGETNLTADFGFNKVLCFKCVTDPTVGATITSNVGPETTEVFVQFSNNFVDNTYGINAQGWPNGHTFGNLTGSDHVQLALLDGDGVKKMEFK